MNPYFKFVAVLTVLIFCFVDEAFTVGMQMYSPGPITRIESTYIIPSTPVVPHLNTTQGFWMGLEPNNIAAVLQNVVGNTGATEGEWGFWPEYCCDPNVFMTRPLKVYPGDEMANCIAQDSSTGEWVMSWSLKPGTEGAAAGERSFSGSFVFDRKLYPAQNPYQSALFWVEVGEPSYWDFGAVVWEDILVEADTTESNWCENLRWEGGGEGGGGISHTWMVSEPYATVSDGKTTCHIDGLNLSGP